MYGLDKLSRFVLIAGLGQKYIIIVFLNNGFQFFFTSILVYFILWLLWSRSLDIYFWSVTRSVFRFLFENQGPAKYLARAKSEEHINELNR